MQNVSNFWKSTRQDKNCAIATMTTRLRNLERQTNVKEQRADWTSLNRAAELSESPSTACNCIKSQVLLIQQDVMFSKV
ncbi:hypothetical protein RB195_019014 [Necator americanus]|uniref:Uncharacterized protein n=1 Tax=Necator americanus TaxID=51031 RepID=A0ABR1CF34_NECAM